MRRYELILFFIALLGLGSQAKAQTTLYLHDAYSPLGVVSTAGTDKGCQNGTNNWVYRKGNTTQGAAAVTKTFNPNNVAPPCTFPTASAGGGDYLEWASPPLSAGVTISGNIDYQVGCTYSAAQIHAALGFVVLRWSVATGGITSIVQTSANTVECSTTLTLYPIAAAAPTSTTFVAGDRIIVRAEVRNPGSFSGNAARTVSITYDKDAAAKADTWVHFADTLSFAAESNNGRAMVQ